MHLIGLDKKLFVIQHKITREEIEKIKLSEDELKKLIMQNIYQKTMELLFQSTKIKMLPTTDGVTWEYRMFMFGEQDLWTLLWEVCDLNPEDRIKLIEECEKILGMVTNK